MTREEEIRIASVDNADKRLKEIPNLGFAIDALADYDNGLTRGFNDGAKWADKTMIDKACKWLEDWDRRTMFELSMIMGSKFIEDFRKAMEG